MHSTRMLLNGIRKHARGHLTTSKEGAAAKTHFAVTQQGTGLHVSYLADAKNFMLLYGKSLSFSTCAQECGEGIACCNLENV